MKLGFVTVAFEYSRPVGLRTIHGGVTLRFAPADSFKFASSAAWPSSDNFTNEIERGVRVALAEKGVQQTSCEVIAIDWDRVDSCAVAFETAARLATLAAFGTGNAE